MDLRYSEEDERFRQEVAQWMTDNLCGEFECLRGAHMPGGPEDMIEERRAWELVMGKAGWIGIGLPKSVGGRDLPLQQQVIFYEEYARADGPHRIGHVGEGLAAPTIAFFGTDEQKKRFLPGILSGEDIWCQGYSEPNAGSDLANVQTRAVRDGDEYVINGQKVWTSGADWSDWVFIVCSTDPEVRPKHKGISYLLVSMDQPGVTTAPIVQITKECEFSETFFTDARTSVDNRIGEENGGWKVSMGTLSFERGASTLGQQLAFAHELEKVIEVAKENGAAKDPIQRQKLADSYLKLRIMRFNAMRALDGIDGGELDPVQMVTKLYWANWHRDLGELAMEILGTASDLLNQDEKRDYNINELQKVFLFSRSETIYAGSNEIQRNIIGERALGLPREPRP